MTLFAKLANIEQIDIIMYADDLTITISDTKPEIIQSKFNTVDTIIKEWCHDNKMIISNKTKTMLFTNKYSEDVTKWDTNEYKLAAKDEATSLLGIKFDTHFTFGKHIDYIVTEGRRRQRQLSSIRFHNYISRKTLYKFYKTHIESILLYGCEAWGMLISDTHMRRIQAIQLECLRIILGATISTNTAHLYRETGCLPIQEIIELRNLKKICKDDTMPDNDIIYKHNQRTIIEQGKRQNKDFEFTRKMNLHNIKLELRNKYIPKTIPAMKAYKNYPYKSWRTSHAKHIKIFTSTIEPTSTITSSMNKAQRQIIKEDRLESNILTMKMHNKKYRKNNNTILDIFTDAFVKSDKATGAVIFESSKTTKVYTKMVGSNTCSMYAEANTIKYALTKLEAYLTARDSKHYKGKHILICTDSQSTVSALCKGPIIQKHAFLANIWKTMQQLHNRFKINFTIQFVYSHCGFRPNDDADYLANARMQYAIKYNKTDTSTPTWINDLISATTNKYKLLNKYPKVVLDKANTSFQEVYHLNQIRYNNRNRKLENSTKREFYSELSRIRAEECIKFGAFPRRLNMITDQDCRACCPKTNTAPTNVTYSSLKHLKRFYSCPYHGENSTRAKGGGRCLNFASKNLKEILEHCYQYHGMVINN